MASPGVTPIRSEPLYLKNELDKSRSPYVSLLRDDQAMESTTFKKLIEKRFEDTCTIPLHGKNGSQKPSL